jgi:hypothetical protein
MFCDKCGAKLGDASVFCNQCGAKLNATNNVSPPIPACPRYRPDEPKAWRWKEEMDVYSGKTRNAEVVETLRGDIQSGGGAVKVLLEAHLDKSDKVAYFYKALSKYIETISKPGWKPWKGGWCKWSWWGFFGSFFYFFYRKMYFVAISFFAITIVAMFVVDYLLDEGHIIASAMAITCGGSASSMYCRKFINDLKIAGYPNKSVEEVLPALRRRGGYNNWAIAPAVIISILAIIAVFSLFAFNPSKEAVVEANAVGLVNEILARNNYDDFICKKVSVLRKLSDRMYICYADIDKYSGTMYVSAKYFCEIIVTLEGDEITVELRGEPKLLKEDP